ncbi:MAG: biopolymer transporter ExbD [Gemmataceae bacterium]|jgi:biopolymer transport protein ExbD|nr:biopolymer transporter ExbD [Gemmataceae bacterium]
MSHGAGGGGGVEEPNLTPLLDLVLQLVMFFMLVANFIQQDFSAEIRLPTAVSAKPITAREPTFILVNVTSQGEVVLENRTLKYEKDPAQITTIMSDQYKRIQRVEGKDRAEQATVILRADAATSFDKVYRVMKACKAAGFSKVQLRAKVGG